MSLTDHVTALPKIAHGPSRQRFWGRRAFLASGLAVAAAGPVSFAWAAAGAVAFEVHRKGKKIGEHAIEFSRAGDALTMKARVEMSVGLGPITFFRYRHRQTERWVGDQFDVIETSTKQNGATFNLLARHTSSGVRLEGAKGGGRTLSAAALPLTHWRSDSLSKPLFNPQDGKMMRLSVAKRGPAPVMMADGRTITSNRIVLAGQTSIEDWYDTNGDWAGLKAKADDGSIVEYRRL